MYIITHMYIYTFIHTHIYTSTYIGVCALLWYCFIFCIPLFATNYIILYYIALSVLATFESSSFFFYFCRTYIELATCLFLFTLSLFLATHMTCESLSWSGTPTLDAATSCAVLAAISWEQTISSSYLPVCSTTLSADSLRGGRVTATQSTWLEMELQRKPRC